MGEAIRAFAWENTELGPADHWPAALKTITRMVLASRQPMCFWWGKSLVSFWNDAYTPMLGKRSSTALGQPFREVWSDVWADVSAMAEQALGGEATWVENMPLVMTRNGYEELTYFTFSYSPLFDEDGSIAGLLNVPTEMTEAVNNRAALQASYEQAQEHLREQLRRDDEQKVLQKELAHRMKNTLSMAQAIVSQSMRHSTTMEMATATINDRISALSKAQNILTSSSWASAEVMAIVNDALMPHRDHDDRFDVSGPKVSVTAQQALGLSLAVHELATNAAKYGASSQQHGKIEISWSMAADGAFTFSWQESGGPPVATPSHSGFGSRLTGRIVASYFDGKTDIAFLPGGLRYVLTGRIDPALTGDPSFDDAGRSDVAPD